MGEHYIPAESSNVFVTDDKHPSIADCAGMHPTCHGALRTGPMLSTHRGEILPLIAPELKTFISTCAEGNIASCVGFISKHEKWEPSLADVQIKTEKKQSGFHL